MTVVGACCAALSVILLTKAVSNRPRLNLGGVDLRGERADPFARLGQTRFATKITGGGRGGSVATPDISRTAGVCVAAASGIGVVALFLGTPLLAVVALPVLCVPSVAASRKARARQREADREIPQLLDLLAAASSAGLAAPLALRRCVEPLIGPLGDEIQVTLKALDLGGRWSEEMRALAERLQLADLTRAVTLLTRTESLGSSLADGVSDLADQVRSERRARRTERARAAPVKMLFPLVFLVLPAFLLLTVVPVFLTTLRSI